MTLPAVVIATPHKRYDKLVQLLRLDSPDISIIRILTREELTLKKLDEIKPVFIFFPHWAWLIPEDVLSNYECVVFHMTDLPFGRGGSPLQNLIVRGCKDTMLSAIKCTEEIDAGPVYLKHPMSLSGNAEEILIRASMLMQKMILEIVRNRPMPITQKGDIVSFNRRKPEDGDISRLQDLSQIYDYIRMLDASGYPPAFLKTNNFHFEFTDAQYGENFIEAKVLIKRALNE